MADTVVLVTAVGDKKDVAGRDFFPLTVNYQEKTFAAGKIPGGFFKREGRPSEKETLTSRLIDRPIRPLFPDGYRRLGRPDAVRSAFHGADRCSARWLQRWPIPPESHQIRAAAIEARSRRRWHARRRAHGRVGGRSAVRGRHARGRDVRSRADANRDRSDPVAGERGGPPPCRLD